MLSYVYFFHFVLFFSTFHAANCDEHTSGAPPKPFLNESEGRLFSVFPVKCLSSFAQR